MRGCRKLGSGDCPASSLMLLAKSRHQGDALATPENAVASVNAASLILALIPIVELVRSYDALGRRKDGDCDLWRHHVCSSGRAFRPRTTKTIAGQSPLSKTVEHTRESAFL
jgi:hypothetical protein